MSTFETTGVISDITNQVSSRGNKFVTFTLTDDAGNKFDLSLFGDMLNVARQLKPKTTVTVKGALSAREYQDKNGKTRTSPQLRVQWVEPVGKSAQTSLDRAVEETVDSIPF